MKSLIAVLCLLVLAAPAAAQTTTRGSTLQNAPNTTFGCEVAPTIDFALGFTMLPHGLPSCSWWSTGSAATVGDPRSSQVPSTGTVTNVRVRSGNNPAPIRIVVNRIINGLCCGGAAVSGVLQPRANDVTQFTVNLPVESVKDLEKQIAWFDYVGVSAAAGTGTLPIHDQGPASHTPEAAISDPNVIASAMTAPELLPTDGARVTQRGAPGYDVLLQYDHVACPTAPNGQPLARAAQAGCAQRAGTGGGGAPTPPGPAPAPPGPVTAAPARPAAAIGGPATLRARSGRLAVPLQCTLAVACRGTFRLRTRGARPRTLASGPVTVAAGATKTVRPRLNATARRMLRRSRRILARAQFDLGTSGVISRNVTLRR